MQTLKLRDAKALLSAVVEAAERGEWTTITRHGKPAAMRIGAGCETPELCGFVDEYPGKHR